MKLNLLCAEKVGIFSKYDVLGIEINSVRHSLINTANAREAIENNSEITLFIREKFLRKLKFINWAFTRKITLLLQAKESNKSFEWRTFTSPNNRFTVKYFREK
jgi:hypothetical protein